METEQPTTLLSMKAVLARLGGISKPTLYALVDGDFPKPVRISPRRVGFVADEVEEWITAQVAARDAE